MLSSRFKVYPIYVPMKFIDSCSIGSKPEIGLQKDWQTELDYYHIIDISVNVVTLERLSIEQYLAEDNQTRTVLCLRKVAGEIYQCQPLDLTVINRPKTLYDIVKDMLKHYPEYEYFVHPIRAYALDTDFELPIRDDKFKNRLFSSNVSLSEAMDSELKTCIDDFFPQE